MLFFDNERGNCTQVGTLGVKCVYCPDGLTAKHGKKELQCLNKKEQKSETSTYYIYIYIYIYMSITRHEIYI